MDLAVPVQGQFHLPGQELIPVAPSIFVPLTTDLTAPLETKPKNNIQRIEQTMRNVDEHTAKVKANLVQIMAQEKRALMTEAKELERANPGSMHVPVGISGEELDVVARALEAPAAPGMDYNTGPSPEPDFDSQGPSQSLREVYSRRVQALVQQAVQQVEAYGAHMEELQNEYRRSMQAEIQRQTEKDSEGR